MRYASNDRVPYSWPFRWTKDQPIFHAVSSNPLLTECEKVISGPSWVLVDADNVPANAEYCPCSDCPNCHGTGENGRWLGSPGGDYETWPCYDCNGTGERHEAKD